MTKNYKNENIETQLIDRDKFIKSWKISFENQKNKMDILASCIQKIGIEHENKVNTLVNCIQKIGINHKKVLKEFNEQLEIIIKSWEKSCETIKNSVHEFSDKNKLNFYLSRAFLENNPKKVDDFIEKNIWPPIFYFIDKITVGNLIEDTCKEFNDSDIELLIKSKDVKDYYYKSMDTWIDDEQNLHIKELIKEIQINFESNNIYVTTLSLFTLLEYKVDKSRSLKQITRKYAEEYRASKEANYKFKKLKKEDDPAGITKAIEIILYENCFGYRDSTVLEKLYDVFFDKKGACYLYKDTEKNPNYITRHMLHGKKIDLITEERMMSLVFLIDSIHKMLISEDKISRK